MPLDTTIIAGASQIDITPDWPIHLAGYPFAKRTSTGVHDALLSSALYLKEGNQEVIFIGNDIIFVDKEITKTVRERIQKETNILGENIMITATHTHSGPSTITFASGSQDSLLPPVDKNYIKLLEDGMVAAAIDAVANSFPAELGLTNASAKGTGTNRNNPNGPADLEVPVLIVKDALTKDIKACMLVVCMHPTVLHENSKLISGDFPGIARVQLQQEVFKSKCPVIYHTGPAGNQSPRHVTKENTFGEAVKIASALTNSISNALSTLKSIDKPIITVKSKLVDLPKKDFPSIDSAAQYVNQCKERLEKSRITGTPGTIVRADEVRWFGAVEMHHLSKMAATHEIDSVYASCLPAEIQIISIGTYNFVAWPGEIFVEYGLAIKEKCPNTFVIELANGDLQVYIVTKEAADEGIYEASNGIFHYSAGDTLVAETLNMLNCK